MPQQLGKKGSFVKAWPERPARTCISLTKAECRRRDINIAGRTGEGRAVVDADGQGVNPEEVLVRLLREAFSSILAIVKTRRGYQIWLLVEGSVGNGFCAAVGGEVFSGPHLAMLPPSVHPDGPIYEWVIPPRSVAVKADLRSLGLVPDDPQNARATKTGRPKAPALAWVQEEFAQLMASVGLAKAPPGLVLCPWHEEGEASLSVDWTAAVFNCFGHGCNARGGLKALRKLGRIPRLIPISDLLPGFRILGISQGLNSMSRERSHG